MVWRQPRRARYADLDTLQQVQQAWDDIDELDDREIRHTQTMRDLIQETNNSLKSVIEGINRNRLQDAKDRNKQYVAILLMIATVVGSIIVNVLTRGG